MSDQSSRKRVKRYNLRSTRTTLLELNDDCLFMIFELLCPNDYLETANVCQRLRTLAHDYFSLRFKDCVLWNCATNQNQPQRESVIMSRNLLINFGGCIQKIHLFHPVLWRSFDQKKFKLSLITKYCPNLTNVTIYGLPIKSRDAEMWKSFFRNISALTIEECQLVDVTLFDVLSLCPKVKYLEIYYFKEVNSGRLMETEYMPTNLEEIILNDGNILPPQQLTRLIENNVHLRKFVTNVDVNVINVEEIERLSRLQEFIVEYRHVDRSRFLMSPLIDFDQHLEFDDDDYGTADELNCEMRKWYKC